MTLYEVIDRVSQDLAARSQQDPEESAYRISCYLKESLDDVWNFVRSRYCKRPEGPTPDRELGAPDYIVYGCKEPFHPKQVRYVSFGPIEQATDLRMQINWGTGPYDIAEDKEYFEGVGFGHTAVILLSHE